jgi:hypothetical protein
MSVASILSGTPAVLDSQGASLVSCGGVTNGASPQYFVVRGSNSGDAGVIANSTTLGAHSSLYLEGNGAAGDNLARLTLSDNAATLGPVEGAVHLFTQAEGAIPAGANRIFRSGDPRGADRGIMYANWAPLDATRYGTTTGTGAAIDVACASITATSTVRLGLVGTANAGGLAAYAAAIPRPVVVVNAGVGFSINAAAALIYDYLVIG